METTKTKARLTSRDFVLKWASNYRKTTGKGYLINWQADCQNMKHIMEYYNDAQINQLIDFIFFSNHRITKYIRDAGFPLQLFKYNINSYGMACFDETTEIDFKELHLDVPYWDDERTAYVWGRIKDRDIDSLIENIDDKYYFVLLMAKMRVQNKGIPREVHLLYQMWKNKERFKRSAVRGGSDGRSEG